MLTPKTNNYHMLLCKYCNIDDTTTGIHECPCNYVYASRDFLGSGSNGMVYRGRAAEGSKFHGRNAVAVKIILKNIDANSSLGTMMGWNKWCDKLKTLLRLQHNNLVTYHKITIDRADAVIKATGVMDFCDRDLAVVMEKDLLDYKTAINYACQIADGLNYLHRDDIKIMHGDLKPANILIQSIGKENKVMICDLDDFVKIQQERTSHADVSRVVGTYKYMSPELVCYYTQRPGDPVGRGTDIWSLGCIMLDLIGSVMGQREKWLVKLPGSLMTVTTIAELNHIRAVENGWVPYTLDAIPSDMAQCIMPCFAYDKRIRVTAKELLKNLHSVNNTLPNKIAFFVHRLVGGKTVVSACVFDARTNTLESLKLPADLDKKAFTGQIKGLDNEAVFQVVSADNVSWDTVSCNLQEHSSTTLVSSLSSPGCLIKVQNKIYFTNRLQCAGVKSELLEMDLGSGVPSTKRIALPPRFSDLRFLHGAERLGHRYIIFFGEINEVVKTNSIFALCYDTITGSWQPLPSLADGRRDYAVAVVGTDIYVLGGMTFKDTPEGHITTVEKSCLLLRLADVEMENLHWETLKAELLSPRVDHCAFAIGTKLYVYGGRYADGSPALIMETYDIHNTTAGAGWTTVHLKELPQEDGLQEKNGRVVRTVCVPFYAESSGNVSVLAA
ncbi:uncharacterized protein LOC129601895 [Paramacrobiotus metropolitanus]|uniref:uncharacterized protein LOC129601895 n=1 Tax=Paramacrobiotus metropolitanus TaxID=2943436 RepID=UPI0024459194|nr:uncharacterized protein LOC129601895 [Paramacrobiotus metropolitanus]